MSASSTTRFSRRMHWPAFAGAAPREDAPLSAASRGGRARTRIRNVRGVVQPALKSCSFVSAGAAAADLLALSTLLYGFVAAASLETSLLDTHDFGAYAALGVLVAVIMGGRGSAYDVVCLLNRRAAIQRAMRPLFFAIFAEAMALASIGVSPAAILPMAAAAFCAGALVLYGLRSAAAHLIARGIATGRLRYRIAIFGGDAATIAASLGEERSPFVETIGVYDTEGRQTEGPPHSIDALLSRARRERVDAIILAYPAGDASRLREVFTALRSSVADIFISNDLARCGTLPSGHPLAGLPLLPAQLSALTDFDMVLKGAFDRLAGLALLALLSPFLLLVAAAIRIDSPGPVLFRQPRVGYNNALFMMYKFRSMQHHMADRGARRQTSRGDTRITRVGRITRRLSIDELPQLLNVVRGQMSLVGPRPHAPGTNVDGYVLEHVAAGYPLRHRVLPGITGWAQINGSRGALDSVEQITRRVRLDIDYIENWSFWLDLKILFLTAARELVSRRAY